MNVKKFKFKKLASVLLIMAMLFSMMTTVGSAEDLPEGTVFKATFEDDEKQLSSVGGSSLAIVEGGYNSAYSLEISGRQVTYAGAGIDLSTLEGNTSYVVKARVMYNEGSQQSVNLNAQLSYTPSYKGKQWNSVANAKLEKGVWNYIEGVFFLEADTKAPLLYFQATDSANTSFYLDDVELLKVVVSGDTVKIGGEVRKVVATASPTPTTPPNTPTPLPGGAIYWEDFDGAPTSWRASDGCQASVVDDGYTGKGFKATNRVATPYGPKLNISTILTAGTTYKITAWVKYTGTNAPSGVKVTAKFNVDWETVGDTGTSTVPGTWYKIEGNVTMPSTIASTKSLYFETGSDPTLVDLTVDNISFTPVP